MGVPAGYFGGQVDLVMTFLVSCRLALPVILVAWPSSPWPAVRWKS